MDKKTWAPQRGNRIYCENLVCTKSGEKFYVVGSHGSWWEVMRQVAWEDFNQDKEFRFHPLVNVYIEEA